MTETQQTVTQQTETQQSDVKTDTSQSNPALRRLDPLVGEWTMQAAIGGETMAGARTTFTWIAGGAFLIQHARDDSPLPEDMPEWLANSPMPLTTIIGLDDSSEQFSMLYADARGVHRVYQMRLQDGVWEMWRDAPGFFQRFRGVFSEDRHTITAQWEHSPDGKQWEHDFDLTYSKV